MKIKTWNTGRHYSKHGQRMAAIVMHNNKVAFVDMDRELTYLTSIETPNYTSLKNVVMSCYDSNLTENLNSDLEIVDRMKDALEIETSLFSDFGKEAVLGAEGVWYRGNIFVDKGDFIVYPIIGGDRCVNHWEHIQ